NIPGRLRQVYKGGARPIPEHRLDTRPCHSVAFAHVTGSDDTDADRCCHSVPLPSSKWIAHLIQFRNGLSRSWRLWERKARSTMPDAPADVQPPQDFDALRTAILERKSQLPKRLVQVAAYALDHPD